MNVALSPIELRWIIQSLDTENALKTTKLRKRLRLRQTLSKYNAQD